jgi:hypothetical protein
VPEHPVDGLHVRAAADREARRRVPRITWRDLQKLGYGAGAEELDAD